MYHTLTFVYIIVIPVSTGSRLFRGASDIDILSAVGGLKS